MTQEGGFINPYPIYDMNKVPIDSYEYKDNLDKYIDIKDNITTQYKDKESKFDNSIITLQNYYTPILIKKDFGIFNEYKITNYKICRKTNNIYYELFNNRLDDSFRLFELYPNYTYYEISNTIQLVELPNKDTVYDYLKVQDPTFKDGINHMYAYLSGLFLTSSQFDMDYFMKQLNKDIFKNKYESIHIFIKDFIEFGENNMIIYKNSFNLMNKYILMGQPNIYLDLLSIFYGIIKDNIKMKYKGDINNLKTSKNIAELKTKISSTYKKNKAIMLAATSIIENTINTHNSILETYNFCLLYNQYNISRHNKNGFISNDKINEYMKYDSNKLTILYIVEHLDLFIKYANALTNKQSIVNIKINKTIIDNIIAYTLYYQIENLPYLINKNEIMANLYGNNNYIIKDDFKLTEYSETLYAIEDIKIFYFTLLKIEFPVIAQDFMTCPVNPLTKRIMCGETTILNIFNYFLYNIETDTFDLNKLTIKNALVVYFYTKNNTMQLVKNNKNDFFILLQNIKSDISEELYLSHDDDDDGHDYSWELRPTYRTICIIIANLFDLPIDENINDNKLAFLLGEIFKFKTLDKYEVNHNPDNVYIRVDNFALNMSEKHSSFVYGNMAIEKTRLDSIFNFNNTARLPWLERLFNSLYNIAFSDVPDQDNIYYNIEYTDNKSREHNNNLLYWLFFHKLQDIFVNNISKKSFVDHIVKYNMVDYDDDKALELIAEYISLDNNIPIDRIKRMCSNAIQERINNEIYFILDNFKLYEHVSRRYKEIIYKDKSYALAIKFYGELNNDNIVLSILGLANKKENIYEKKTIQDLFKIKFPVINILYTPKTPKYQNPWGKPNLMDIILNYIKSSMEHHEKVYNKYEYPYNTSHRIKSEMKDKNRCPVCNRIININRSINKLGCGHLYHCLCCDKLDTCIICNERILVMYIFIDNNWERVKYMYPSDGKLYPGHFENIDMIHLKDYNNELLPYALSEKVDKILLDSFNMELVENVIPKSTRFLYLNSYNKELRINVLPDKIVHLYLNSFNKKLLRGVLPRSIIILRLDSYNQPLEIGVLPDSSIKSLYLNSYNQLLEVGVLPPNINYLDLSSYNIKLKKNILPSNIGVLILNSYNYQLKENILPKELIQLRLDSYNKPLKKNVLPKLGLLSLHNFNQPLKKDSIPFTISNLHLNSYNYQLEKGILPPYIHYLDLSSYNIKLEKDILPSNIVILILNSYNCQLEKNILPEKLIQLHLGSYNHPLKKDVLPKELTQLHLDSYNQPLDKAVIPESVIELYLYTFNKSYNLPRNINTLGLTLLNDEEYIPNHIKTLYLKDKIELKYFKEIGSDNNLIIYTRIKDNESSNLRNKYLKYPNLDTLHSKYLKYKKKYMELKTKLQLLK